MSWRNGRRTHECREQEIPRTSQFWSDTVDREALQIALHATAEVRFQAGYRLTNSSSPKLHGRRLRLSG